MKTTSSSILLSTALKTIAESVEGPQVEHVALTATTTTGLEIHVDWHVPVVTVNSSETQPSKKRDK